MKIDFNYDKILLFDGDCSVCNKSVQFVLKWNQEDNIEFASLQSEIGKSILQHFDLNFSDLSTVVFIDKNQAFIQSDAALQVCNYLGSPIKYLNLLKVIPKAIRNFIYDLIAKNRHLIIRKKYKCIIPTMEMKRRFLD